MSDYSGQLSYTAQETGTPVVSTVGTNQAISSGEKTLSGNKSDILVFTSRKGGLIPTGLLENPFAYIGVAIIAIFIAALARLIFSS